MKHPSTYLAAFLFCLILTPTSLLAQNSDNNNSSESSGPRRFWQANVPGGNYIVAIDRISSISKHTYLIDGGLRVTEVVIDTSGNSLVRFYYIIPVSEDSNSNIGSGLTTRGKELLDKVGQRTGANVNSAVVKQYPATTHSKTVEFRISDEADLNQLYNSASNAWIKGTGRKFTIKAAQ
ncbi:MAG: hypothetical protein KJO21_01715 [Verrucomicrobiae bacterium]|nr:hypothetical protein [Verrucomicrobiae bacterium]NNJ42253.1 hypothetical protein [Akkermansiaceae bacterium]